MGVSKPKRQHFLALDLLRGIAAIGVIFLHWLEGNGNHWFHNSHLAVDFFFILSGFVMAYSYTGRLKQGLGLKNFFLLRLIRLYPLIVVGIILGFVRFALKTIATHDTTMPLWWLAVKLVQNLFMIPNFQDGLSPDMFILNLALWSLFFELVAYVLFGLFMYRSSLPVLIAITVVAGLGVWGWLYQEFGTPKHTIYLLSWEKYGYVSGFSRVMFSFTLGLLTYELFTRLKVTVRINGWIYAAALAVFLSLPLNAVSPTLAFLILLIVFPFLICLAASAYIPAISEGAAKWFGDISYPLYVVHTPLIWLLDGILKVLKLENALPNVWYGWAILPLVVAISYLIFKVYDEPVRAYLTQFYRNTQNQVTKA